uniref:hypothetical protein n=1 Tax=Agathobacter sp. TaxID=2021311 RepID=UPI004055A944
MTMRVCEKIPKPYAFYMSAVVLDRMDWYGKSDMPIYDWRDGKDDFLAGTI